MTATLLSSELTNLISESKRKNADLRNAAEKSLHELKSLPATSEQQLAAACETVNVRLASSGVTCLQKLVISRGLPKTRLQETLDAFNACANLGLDIQLKILQALPSLIQNYATELRDELLAGALQLCASLQSAKAQTVSGVAAATLQQLVSAVFEKVVDEDRKAGSISTTHEVPGEDGPIALRPAAYDAYRMFRDLVLAAEDRPTKFVQLTSLSPGSSLELISSALNANARLFVFHSELSSVISSNLLPAVTRPLSEKASFGLTIRALRLIDTLLSRYFSRFLDEFEVALGLLTHHLELDPAAPWKRVAAMEVLRNFLSRGNAVIDAYAAYDGSETGKSIVQDLLSSFVRLSAEKPAAIGLGQQSSVPAGSRDNGDPAVEQTTLEAATGMAGVISSVLGVAEANVPGISPAWSIPKTACLDQLDKTDAPALPETYIYAMVLDCVNSISDSLARVVLPLTVQHEKPEDASAETSSDSRDSIKRPVNMPRSQSFRKLAVPVNPLTPENGAVTDRLRAVAGLVEHCWPAFLATSSTFLNATLEEQYYRNLIKGHQRFAQVAGLLRLTTPRDALMTTLSKSAVPPHVLNAAMMESTKPSSTSVPESPRIFSNPRNLLSVESLVSQASSLTMDRERRSSIEPARPMLSTRNLLCLRALLNLAIALGPTLDKAFAVIVDVLRQADMILSSTISQHLLRQGASKKGDDAPSAVRTFSSEVAAVESAASRLLESTADYPNDAFLSVLHAFIRLLGTRPLEAPSSPITESVSPPTTPTLRQRNYSGLPGISTLAEMQARDYQFVIPKLGVLGRMNISRFVVYDPADSGWSLVVDELVQIACGAVKPREARRAAASVLCEMMSECIITAFDEDTKHRSVVQRRAFVVMLEMIDGIYADDGELTNTDLEVHSHLLEALTQVLDRCGETLAAGWQTIIAILSTAFERTDSRPFVLEQDMELSIEWHSISSELVAAHVARVAFSATQLICSDFLAALPLAVMPSLLELLYRYTAQEGDLNMALTTVTMTLAVAGQIITDGPAEEMESLASDLEDTEDMLADVENYAPERKAAQLLLLMLRLRNVVRDTKSEIRNAAFQTVCSITKIAGTTMTPKAWDLLLRHIFMGIAANDIRLYASEDIDAASPSAARPKSDHNVSAQIMQGVANLVVQHISVIEQSRRLPSLWEIFLTRLEAYLDCEDHKLNTSVYTALAGILAQVREGASVWTTPIYRTIAFWLKRPPELSDDEQDKQDNQASFVAYMDTATELYRLAKGSISGPQTRKMIDNIFHCVERSNGPRYAADVNSMSTLQTKAMQLLENIRVGQDQLLSSLIVTASEISLLHHKGASSNTNHGPTFIAISSHAIDWLASLVQRQATTDKEDIDMSALSQAVRALQHIVQSKYAVPAKCKDKYLWQQATTTALRLVEPILRVARDTRDISSRNLLWTAMIQIVAGTVNATGLDIMTDQKAIKEDEHFDIESFEKWKGMLVPCVGDASLPVDTRISLVRALFDASIVHRIEPSEVPDAFKSPLEGLLELRRPRARRVPFSPRERLSYVCFDELIALATCQKDSTEHTNLAQAAAPLLVLRLAVPIRAYVIDHPLRGRRPQPLSELEELLFVFEKIKTIKLHPQALAADPVASRRSGPDAHVHCLYPLLVKAVAVASNKWCGAEEVLLPLQSVLEGIAPMP
ncbi:Endocytosis and vacuole integrity protein [Recurvomyces mirabilis]|nr:Endocytosis and vacuole integrity protein [Recurvomyces mirabilis]